MEYVFVTLLSGLSYGLLLFMLSSGLTLILGMMGVLNFAHASFYMLGAYFGYSLSSWLGFIPALVLAPLAVGVLGGLVEKFGLRHVHRYGHVAELLLTFALSYLIVEAVKLIWGVSPVAYRPPSWLEGSLTTILGSPFPKIRAFAIVVALLMLLALYLLLTRTRVGILVQASLTHPDTVEGLGHNVPLIFTIVFSVGSGLAALAGVVGGAMFLTEPAMAEAMGSIAFVVLVIGGMGSLGGAFLASMLVGTIQTFAVGMDHSIASVLKSIGFNPPSSEITSMTIAQMAPMLPFLMLIVTMVLLPRGLFGKRES